MSSPFFVQLRASVVRCCKRRCADTWVLQKGKLAEAAALSEEHMASWKREGDAPWHKGKEEEEESAGQTQEQGKQEGQDSTSTLGM